MQNTKGVIFSSGEYPQGSSAQRLRMIHYGLKLNDVSTIIIISDYVPSNNDKKAINDNLIQSKKWCH